MDWIYYNLIILITYCKIPYKIWDKTLLFSRNQVCLQKGVWDFILFYLDPELFKNVKKHMVSTHSSFTHLLITQDLNKIRKTPHILLSALLSRKRVQNFSKKILNFMVVGARQSFQFFRQKSLFLGNNRGLP